MQDTPRNVKKMPLLTTQSVYSSPHLLDPVVEIFFMSFSHVNMCMKKTLGKNVTVCVCACM